MGESSFCCSRYIPSAMFDVVVHLTSFSSPGSIVTASIDCKVPGPSLTFVDGISLVPSVILTPSSW